MIGVGGGGVVGSTWSLHVSFQKDEFLTYQLRDLVFPYSFPHRHQSLPTRTEQI